MSAEQLFEFEIHTGFSKRAIGLVDRLPADERHLWKILHVAEVVNGPESMDLFDAHDVPGVLGLMATKRARSTEEALAEVNRVARMYATEPDVRIELEQVVMTIANGSSSSVPATSWTPTPQDFKNGTLIPETPLFEAHFSLKAPRTGDRLPHSTKRLIEIATSAGIPVHQAVRFTTEDQVILTTFFEEYGEMVEATPALTEAFRRALDGGARLKVVAERIIACLQPRNEHASVMTGANHETKS